jgi:hypothetical protein
MPCVYEAPKGTVLDARSIDTAGMLFPEHNTLNFTVDTKKGVLRSPSVITHY